MEIFFSQVSIPHLPKKTSTSWPSLITYSKLKIFQVKNDSELVQPLWADKMKSRQALILWDGNYDGP